LLIDSGFCGDTNKCNGYASGVDFYNKLASSVFDYEVDRKLKDDSGKKVFGMEGAIGKTGELGLGYGMGAAKFWETCAKGPMGEDPIHLPHGVAKKTVDTWRFQNQSIVSMWGILDGALEAMSDPKMTPFMIGPIQIQYQRIRLPNKMFLNYPKLTWRKSVFNNDDGSDRYGFSYWTGKWFQDTWGGTMLENVIQALSRIIMSDSLERCDKHFLKSDLGWMVLTVHDENVAIVREDSAKDSLEYALEDMRISPQWATDLPLDAEGGINDYYAKG
jgi:DNA polymerase